MKICYQGITYMTERLSIETDEQLARRLWFIIKLKPKNDLEYAEAERLSRLWFNMNFLGCRYSEEVEEMIYSLCDE